MSKVIEERVTEMRFDNRDFEQNVQTSLSTIEKLKQSLNLQGASKGLEAVSSVSESMTSGLGSALDTVRSKFSALEVIGITALANITNSAINAGKRMISALTIDPISTGFQEYETQINAVQTILANTQSKGSTLEDVNNALNELNKYADMTIYNFTEMTRNIGTFTAAGVDLDTSVSAIKGIANLAAVSGSNSQQASTAMYQLSQALAAGAVKLQDWNSVVNAGMGGQVFQDALKETARVHGIAIDQMIEDEGSFRETLSEGWLTSEILTETLSKFTGDLNEEQLKTMGYTEEQIESIIKMGQTANDAATKVKTFTQLFDTLAEAAQSGWTQSWQIIIGDFEEAKELLTTISDVVSGFINNMSDARNNVLQSWKDLGGRTALIEGLTNVFNGLVAVMKPIGEAFREAFPAMTGDKLFAFTEGFKELTKNLIVGEEVTNRLKLTFKGIFSVFSILKSAITATVQAATLFVGIGIRIGDMLLSITAVIGNFISNLDNAIKKSNIFGTIFETLGKILAPIGDFITNIANKIGLAFDHIDLSNGDGLVWFMEVLKSLITPLGKIGDGLAWVLGGITTVINAGADGIGQAFTWISEKVGSGVDATIKAFKPVSKIGEFFGTVFDGIVIAIKFIGEKISQVFTWLRESLSEAIDTGDVSKIFGIVNGGIFTGILLGLKKIINGFADIADGGSGFIEGITDTLDAVKDTLGAYQSQLKAGTLLKIASAIAILAGSLLVLSLIDSEKLVGALAAMGTVMTELFTFMYAFDKLSGGAGFGSMTKASIGMIGLATAVLILSSAMVKMGQLDWKQIAKGLTSIAGMSATLVLSANLMSKNTGKIIKTSAGLILFATALRILATSVKTLSDIEPDKLVNGLTGVGILCAELAVFLRTANFDGLGLSKGLGLMALATSLLILYNAVDKLGDLSVKELIKGLGSVGVILAELALFTKITDGTKGMISTSIGLTILAGSMLIFGIAIEKIGNLSLEQIGKGLLTMVGSLVSIALAMKIMPKDLISKGTGMVILASSLLILSNALGTMGNFEWEQIARGLTTLAGALTIISVAMFAMKSALPGAAALLVVSAALMVLTPVLRTLGGMEWSEIGKGLLALAGAFTVIGLAGLILSPIIPAIALLAGAITLLGVGCLAAGAGVLAFATGLASLAVVGGAGVTVIVSLIMGLISTIPLLIQKIGEGLVAFAQVIIDSAPVVAEAFLVVLQSIITAIVESIPMVLQGMGDLIMGIINLVVEYLPDLIDAGLKIIIGLMTGIRDNIDLITSIAVSIIVNFINTIAAKLPDIIDAGFNLIVSFVDGLAIAVENNVPRLIDAGDRLFKALIDAGAEVLENSVENFISLGANIVGGLIKGIWNGVSGVVSAIADVASAAIEKGKEVLDIHSPSRVFKQMGRFCDEGLADGVSEFAYLVSDATEDMGSDTVKSIEDILKGIDFDFDDPEGGPTVRPVLDMSLVEKGMAVMDGLFKEQQTVSLGLAGGGTITAKNLRSISGMSSRVQNDNSDVVSAIKDLKKSISNTGGDTNIVNGITYDDGSNVSTAIKDLVRATKIRRRS